MSSHHTAVWLDHNDARIFHLTSDGPDDPIVHAVVTSPTAHTKLHRKLGSDDGHRAPESQPYYHAIALALADADEVLVLGPATAKQALIAHARMHDPQLAARLVGVETVDHPTDRQIAALVRRYYEQRRPIARA